MGMASPQVYAQQITDRYLQQVSDLTKRKNFALAMMKSRGRIKHGVGAGGDLMIKRKVRYRSPERQYRTEGQSNTFERRNLYKDAEMTFREYVMTDMCTWEEETIRQNAGSEQIIDRIKQMLPIMMDEMREQLGYDIHGDGTTKGNRWDQPIEGFDSFCSHDAAQTASGDIIAYPTGTYHGMSMVPQAHGGEWPTTAGLTPDGTGLPNTAMATCWPFSMSRDPGYDCWMPKLWKYDTTGWGTTKTTWKDNCIIILRTAASVMRLTTGVEGPLAAIMAGHMLTDVKMKLHEDGARFELTHPLANRLGFPTVINFEGTMLNEDFGVTGNRVDLWNFDKVRLLTATKDLFVRVGKGELSEDNFARKMAIAFLGNIEFESPRYAASIRDWTASA